MAGATIDKMQSARNAVPALPPIGLGERGGEFDRVFIAVLRKRISQCRPRWFSSHTSRNRGVGKQVSPLVARHP